MTYEVTFQGHSLRCAEVHDSQPCGKHSIGHCRDCSKPLCKDCDTIGEIISYSLCRACALAEIIKRNNEKKNATVLEKADELVGGDRQKTYGPPAENYRRVAEAWSAILNYEISPRDVCLCMIVMKAVRDAHSPKEDNIIDIAGYARVIELIEKGE